MGDEIYYEERKKMKGVKFERVKEKEDGGQRHDREMHKLETRLLLTYSLFSSQVRY